MSIDNTVLVGDIGGTHSRFAVVDVSGPTWRITRRIDIEADGRDFPATLRSYLDQAGLRAIPGAAAIAVAGPVSGGAVTLTNRNWRFSESDLRGLGFHNALLINDFATLAFSIAVMAPGDVHTIGPEIAGIDGEPISIIGAGTGFGAACLARFHGRAVPVATEGGHAGFAPSDPREIEVLEVLQRRFDHVSIERVLSGPGIENLHAALAEIAGRKTTAMTAAQIVAAQDNDPTSRETVEMFCAIYGSVAGDFALVHGARGGVYLAGGIAQKIEQTLVQSTFRARFEAKGRMSAYVKAIPTKLILSEDTAFLGAARASLEFRQTES